MKVVKITSMTCTSCIIMNNIINKLKNNYQFDIEEYDYDFDEVEEFNVRKILPVLIFYKNNQELKRLEGEHSYEELEKVLLEVKNEEV